MNTRFAWLLPALILVACAPEPEPARIHSYFNLEAFTQTQATRLDSLRPWVEKKVRSENRTETKRLRAINWQKELDLFAQADLNKPAYRTSYTVVQPTAHSFEYRLKPGEDVPVRYMKVAMDSRTGQLQSLEAEVVSENYLYHSRRLLTLQCGPGPDGTWLVRSYHISGFQQLAFFAQKPFEVSGKVVPGEG